MLSEIFALVAKHWMISGAIALGGFYLVSSIIEAIKSTARARAFERSRQDAMAYVAEGSITSEQAALLLALKPGGAKKKDKKPEKDASTRLAAGVAEWSIDQKDADKLIAVRAEVDDKTWEAMVNYALQGMDAEAAIKLAKAARSGTATAATAGQAVPA